MGNRKYLNKNKNEFSTITYAGHSIFAKGYTRVVRYNSNTVNLDVGTFQTQVSLVANHTKGTSYYFCLRCAAFNDIKSNQNLVNAKIELEHLSFPHLKCKPFC